MQCCSCEKRVTPGDSVKIGHLDSKDSLRLCLPCHESEGRSLVEDRFGALMDARHPASASRKSKPAKAATSWGSTESARKSRQRGIEHSRQVRNET